MATTTSEHLNVERRGAIFIIIMQKPPENRLTMKFAQQLIDTYRAVERELSSPKNASREGAVILKGDNAKFFSTGLDLDEGEVNPHANTDGFYPLLRTILDFPFPTVCLITGHCFGGACLLTLAHDYRIMNSERGFWSMPPVNLGLHFDGIGALLRAKLVPQVARTVLLEANKYTGIQALGAGIVDEVAKPDEMFGRAITLAERVKERAKMGVFAVLREELYGDAKQAFQVISHVHARDVGRASKVKAKI